ncbi:integrase arm-type DNA-binding domain-containing protein [Shewanella sp. Isolate7]|uniref:integrase arm-type DNA-binding domain-containing protein n=1 Tax=Shewanella sp. Isolate7 TaxID=2908528 RepID=UPI0031F3112F
MGNTTKQLSATQVANAKPRDKEYNLSDGRGLSLRVKTSGSRFWLLNYTRPITKKRANLGLGTYPDVSLAEARKVSVRQTAPSYFSYQPPSLFF